MTLQWVQGFGVEISASLSDGRTWFAFLAAFVVGAGCLAFGVWATRRVGLLERTAPAGETLSVGMGAGLLILASWWAALDSGGRSSFTPVAITFAIAIGLPRKRSPRQTVPTTLAVEVSRVLPRLPSVRMPLIGAITGAALFLVIVGVLYGATMAPSPRNGEQPVEFMDEAYYSLLGANLARSGTESIYSPSGFDELPGLPVQTWYHWGELWLTASVITLFGIDPLIARHVVVLPLVLLAAATLTGTVVRRIGRSRSRSSFTFGLAASLFLAPIPMPGTFFGSWATGLIFGVTMYGLALVSVLLVLHSATVVGRMPTLPTTTFVAALIGSLVPTHIVIASLALVGAAGIVVVFGAKQVISARQLPALPPWLTRTASTAILLVLATVAWGIATGHGIGTSGLSRTVSPFNDAWRDALSLVVLGAGVMLAIPIAWLFAGRRSGVEAWLYVGTTSLLVVGALAWGARLGDFTMFHVFFGGVAAFAAPIAAIAILAVLKELRHAGRFGLAAGLVILCVLQLEVGAFAGIVRLQLFGPHAYRPIPVAVLDAVSTLPNGAKIAYACQPFEEIAFWDPRLMSIAAHTGKPVVPMCFEAEFLGFLTGTQMSTRTISPLFLAAPQRALFPDSAARPSTAVVVAFLRSHGIGYIYADADHPNTLASGAVPIIDVGGTQLLRIP